MFLLTYLCRQWRLYLSLFANMPAPHASRGQPVARGGQNTLKLPGKHDSTGRPINIYGMDGSMFYFMFNWKSCKNKYILFLTVAFTHIHSFQII